MAEQSLNFRDIDYRGLKEGLITFLRNTDAFKDANFEGSFLNHLVNMLSYTGSIFGNYVNGMANEQYIGTCNLYETGNMLGSLVGYKSHGYEGAEVSITITPDFDSMGITDNLSNYYGWECIIPRNAQFTTRTSNERNKSLIFCNKQDSIITIKNPDLDPNGDPNAAALELIQGIPLSIDFISDGTELMSFEIPNPFIDWSNVKVYVMNENSEEEEWESASTFFFGDPDSKIFIPFINPKGLLEIMFAEGNYGSIPESGRTIRIEYYATQGVSGQIDSGMIGDMSTSIYFVNPDDSLDVIKGEFTVTQENASTIGRNIEVLDKIKKFAPLYFGIQNRLVNEFDYSYYILGEYPSIVDCKAFSYERAVEERLLRSPCENILTNPKFTSYVESSVADYDEPIKIPTSWGLNGFQEVFVVETEDTLPIAPVNGEPVVVGNLLNFGTSSALYVDSSRPCNDNRGAVISQSSTVSAPNACCNIVQIEVEVMNPNIDLNTGTYPEVTKNNISLYINGELCYIRIDPFIYNLNGYTSSQCCCDREGDIRGWYIVKGIMILDNSIINNIDDTAAIEAQVFIKPNSQLLIGDIRVYPNIPYTSNDIFVVPVPENSGYLGIEIKEDILDKLELIDMVNVRNHIIAPIYQTFDIRVVYKKDETSILTQQEITNSIRTELINEFLPINRKLGDRLSTIELANLITDLPGVIQSRVILTPKNIDMQARVDSWGDFQLTEAEFPVLGKVTIG